MDGLGQALQQVRTLRGVLERSRFDGLSGRARLVTAGATVATGLCLWLEVLPAQAEVHLLAWLSLCAFAVSVNLIALTRWFWFEPSVGRDWRRLAPVLDLVPPLFVGMVLTIALCQDQAMDLLFGAWMVMFGLCNLAARHFLPRALVYVGVLYVACGTVCLLMAHAFLNPLPMLATFAVGEALGGVVMLRDRTRTL